MNTVQRALQILQTDGVKVLTQKSAHKLKDKIITNMFTYANNPIPLLQRYYSTCRLLFPDRYTDADPFKVIYVDPHDIRFEQGLQYNTRDGPTGWARVVEGDWDKNKIRFDDCFKYKSIYRRYKEKVPWEKTEYYQRYVEKVKTDPPVYGCESPNEMKARFQHLDDIYESIQENGFKTQKQLLAKNPDLTQRDLNDGYHPLMNEITVNITRNGNLIYSCSGRNRLCMAKVSDVDKVPVQVRTRHKSWQEVRENILSSRNDRKRISDHPDLQDLIH
ncbi:hypothetical protein AArcSl_2945 [Halalkaliarchaeum desulfuricum]|uniref:Uncharacterized protein n=1 Tax=Halalkaliarchaeum desulfuricum TaxID=2055893 RepID=A0A343TN84_9EURY|nr:hypothetical protein [Halalkaliarchaeum desulfuricum]AUX10556.1 hypothetical protein AArcSl_2945 [Halalkaliarchaeum desulfuricum]